MLGALIGAIGFWVVLGLIALFTWLATEHPLLCWALIFTAASAAAGYRIAEGLH